MRIFTVLLLILFSKNLVAQPKNSPYLYDSSDETMHILLVEYPQTKISLHVHSFMRDTAGIYKDDMVEKFSFYQTGTIANRVIKLTFNKPVDFCELKCVKGVSHITAGSNADKTEYTFFINQIKADEFSFIVYSKEGVSTKIQELSKYIH